MFNLKKREEKKKKKIANRIHIVDSTHKGKAVHTNFFFWRKRNTAERESTKQITNFRISTLFSYLYLHYLYLDCHSGAGFRLTVARLQSLTFFLKSGVWGIIFFLSHILIYFADRWNLLMSIHRNDENLKMFNPISFIFGGKIQNHWSIFRGLSSKTFFFSLQIEINQILQRIIIGVISERCGRKKSYMVCLLSPLRFCK